MTIECRTVSALLMCCVLTGCSTARLADLNDCAHASVGLGVGLSVDARLGMIAHPSLGAVTMTQRIGNDPHVSTNQWKEMEFAFPFTLARTFHPNMSYVRLYDNSFTQFVTGVWLPIVPPQALAHDGTWFNSLTDLEVGATLGVASLRVGVNPLEILDFVFGFLGLDLAADDPKSKESANRRPENDNLNAR